MTVKTCMTLSKKKRICWISTFNVAVNANEPAGRRCPTAAWSFRLVGQRTVWTRVKLCTRTCTFAPRLNGVQHTNVFRGRKVTKRTDRWRFSPTFHASTARARNVAVRRNTSGPAHWNRSTTAPESGEEKTFESQRFWNTTTTYSGRNLIIADLALVG